MNNSNMDVNRMFIPDAGVVKAGAFSDLYPLVNYYMFTQKEYEESRNGNVKEMLDMKTVLLNPYRRCVGGCERDINIFFLLAEAIWIALGKKDVSFLSLFNKKMTDFSDDGKIFHAPYGYRLRHWGVRTEDSVIYDNLSASKGYDQVIDAIKIFTENNNSRQVVMSIWNPNFDLGYKTKDIPCNDMVMLKIRKGKLITTIQNRSNDLHWGLPTNIFQFSFLTELMAATLEVELGTQTHNSQSLHVYEWNDVSGKMNDLFIKRKNGEAGIVLNMYDEAGAKERKMDFKFIHEIPANRFREIEYNLSIILDNLIRISKGETQIEDEISELASFSNYLFNVYHILKIYLEYKSKMSSLKTNQEKDLARRTAISEIEVLEANMPAGEGNEYFNWDISMLAKNFFASRLSVKMNHEYLGKL